MNPTGLPELFQQPRDLNNNQEVEILKFQTVEKIKNERVLPSEPPNENPYTKLTFLGPLMRIPRPNEY